LQRAAPACRGHAVLDGSRGWLKEKSSAGIAPHTENLFNRNCHLFCRKEALPFRLTEGSSDQLPVSWVAF
jgi:hypothetical protein